MFGWREPLQVLVGPDVVVENFELIQGHLQRSPVGHGELFEQGLERAKQSLDPAVLPWGVFLGGLMVDARQSQKALEHPTVEDRLVVGAQFAGLAMLGNGQAQMTQHGPTATASERVQARNQTAGVVQDAYGGMGALLLVGAKAQVHGPSVIDRNDAGLGGSDLAAQFGNVVLVMGDELSHKRLAHAGVWVQAVEGACHAATTGMGHVRFEAQEFVAYPVGFAVVVGVLGLGA